MTNPASTPPTNFRPAVFRWLSSHAQAAKILVWAAVLIWLTQLGRLLPGMSATAADRGVFVSVGERILAGNRLYVEVWDNKDPLFFYFTAMTRLLGPIGDFLGVLGIMLATTWIAYQIAGEIGTSRDRKLLLLSTVLILGTGACFWPGSTHALGILICLAILLTSLRNQPLAAGFLLGLLFFTKITMMPIAGLMLIPWLWSQRRSGPVLGQLMAGTAGSTAITLGLLWFRQELAGYRDALVANLGYSTALNSGSFMDGIIEHLRRTLTPTALVMLCVSLIVAIAHKRLVKQQTWQRIRIRQAIWLSGFGSILALSLTGMWGHHAQTLLVGSTLALILALDLLPKHAGIAWLASMAAAVILGGGTVTTYVVSPAQVRQDFQNLRYPPPTTRALLATSTTTPITTYARVGHNDDAGHAYKLRHLQLACPYFHQYNFDPQSVFDKTLSCLPSADAIILAPSFAAEPTPGATRWNHFVREVEILVLTEYNCQPAGSGRICIKKQLTQRETQRP